MQFRLDDVEPKLRYKLISGAIVPRPIALVTTTDQNGFCNAAPFSAFNYVSEDPPLVAIGLQTHYESGSRAGEVKDTTRNVTRSGEFVVNFVDEALCKKMVDCAVPFPAEESEPSMLGLATTPSISLGVPRLTDAPIAFECRRVVILNFSNSRSVLIGEVIAAFIRDDIINAENFYIDLAAYRPVGRLFGSLYCRTDQQFSIPTPTYDQWTRTNNGAQGR